MGYNGVGPVAAGGTAAGMLAATGVDVLLWSLVGVLALIAGLVLIRLSLLQRSEGD
ncbi:MAG TPA: hypothetical protein VM677_21865 [Actinokineospora sp.]|jgi:hypothetical protein|nr:hypothetical protein [Actinokineospora sp.]